MKYKILTNYTDSRFCPPEWKFPINLRKGDIVDVICVEAAGSGKYFVDRNNDMYRGHYLATFTINDDPLMLMMDFELLNLMGDKEGFKEISGD